MPDANDTLTYEYDALRRIKVETRQDNSTVTLKYDLAGRMEERIYSDSTTDTFEYDDANRLTQAVKDRHDITVEREYYPDGTMREEKYILDTRTYTLTREYDDANRVTKQTFADGKVMTWDYDDRHLVTQAHYDGALVLSQAHDAGYRLTQQTFGNSLVRNITYNRADNQRMADTVKQGITTIPELAFTYDYLADKNVQKEKQTSGTFEDLSFTAAYDPGNRVTSYNRKDAYVGARETQSWNYDGAGNWNSTDIDGSTQSRTHSASDQLEVIAGDNLTYDPRGNQLTDNRGNEYTWDLDNRIVEADGTGYSNIEYRYDALGRRIVRKQGTHKEVLLWWNNTEQSEHKHQAGQITIQNDLQADPSEGALNTIFARALEGDKQDIQYYHKNYLDHVMAVSDDNGNILEHYRYTAFGEPEIYAPNGTKLTATAIYNDILWNVRRYESATNLYLYKYRDYDAVTGRWPSRDPIAERGGVNLYCFVENNGVGRVDVLGLAVIMPLRVPTQAEIRALVAAGDALLAAEAAAVAEVTITSEVLVTGVITSVSAEVVAILALTTTSMGDGDDTRQMTKNTREELIAASAAKKAERIKYSKRCTETDPPELTGCDLLCWRLKRNEECQKLRLEFGKKWYNDTTHDIENINVAKSVVNARKAVEDNGCCCE
jgi:RHS repeat-associated protein